MTSSTPTPPPTDEQLEDIRDWHNKTRDHRVGVLLAALDRLRTWDGLMELLDEKWPEDIFPTLDDDNQRDPGPRIVSLLRWVDQLRAEAAEREEGHRGALNAMDDVVLMADAESSGLRTQIRALADWLVKNTGEPKSSVGAVDAAIHAIKERDAELDRLRPERDTLAAKLDTALKLRCCVCNTSLGYTNHTGLTFCGPCANGEDPWESATTPPAGGADR